MKKTVSLTGVVLLSLFIVMALFVAPVLAQEKINFGDMGFEGEIEGYEVLQTETRPPETDEFGVQDFNYVWIPACQFLQHFTDTTQRLGTYSMSPGMYVGRAGDSGPYFTAAINLPTGVDIYQITLYYYDNNATYNIYGWYWRHKTATNTLEELKSFNTTGTPGHATYGFDPWPNNIIDNYNTYIFRIRLDVTGSSMAFRGVRIKYKRKISPKPSASTFWDVPTTHGFHQHIEALAASGITTGYSDGSFKPNDYVTRGQMAAFLTRALGLHNTDPN